MSVKLSARRVYLNCLSLWYHVTSERAVGSDEVDMDIVALKAAIAVNIRFGAHGLQPLLDDNLDINEVRAGILATGDMIEDYPNDPRGPSCLVLSLLPDGGQVHTAWGWHGTDVPILITAYRPRPDKFLPDGRTRR